MAIQRSLMAMLIAATLAPVAIAPVSAGEGPFHLTRLDPVDGRTFQSESGKMFRLAGIHVPALGQACVDGEKQVYDCGQKARTMLGRYGGGLLSCTKATVAADDVTTVRCTDFANRDVAQLLVREGWAVPDRASGGGMLYGFDAMEAKARRKGLWDGTYASSVW